MKTLGIVGSTSLWEGTTCSVWSTWEGCVLQIGAESVLVGPRRTDWANFSGMSVNLETIPAQKAGAGLPVRTKDGNRGAKCGAVDSTQKYERN